MTRHEPDKAISEREIQWREWGDPIHGDLPGVRWAHIFSEREAPGMGMVEIAPDSELPEHHHTPIEVYFVISGEGFVTIGEGCHRLAAGTTVFIPSNVPHRTVNDGEDALRILYNFPSASFCDVDYHLD